MTDLPFSIVPPSLADWRKFKALRLESLKNDPPAFGRTYDEEAAISDKEWQEKLAKAVGPKATELMFVAAKAGKFIGLIGAFPKKDTVGIWVLKSFYVTPRYRRQGVGRMLLQKILAALHQRNDAQKIELRVNVEQTAAIKLYRDFGFEVAEILKSDAGGNGVPCNKYVMIRKIKQPAIPG